MVSNNGPRAREEVRIFWVKNPRDRKKSTREALVTDKNRLRTPVNQLGLRVKIDMVRKVCKQDPLVERRVYTRSESDPKISAGIFKN